MVLLYLHNDIFTRGTLAIARVLAVAVCLYVRPSVRLSQVGVLLKWLNAGSRKQRYRIAQGL